MSLNIVVLLGNLTRDPETTNFSNTKVCKFGIAAQTDKNSVCFIEVAAWGNLADSCQQYLKKGKLITVEGRLKFETWEKDGKKNSKHVIVASKIDFLNKDNEEDNPQNFS